MSEAPKSVSPVGLPVRPGSGEIAQALAEAGKAFLKLAALLGEGSFAPAAVRDLSTPELPPSPNVTDQAPYCASQSPPSGARHWTVSEASNEFLLAKAKASRSDRYLRQLRVTMTSFGKGRAQTALAALTAAEVEKWIFSQEWEPKTMRNHLSDVKTFLHWCIRRGYLARDLISHVELPPVVKKPILIHTPDEVRIVLETARRLDKRVMRLLAIRYFAGVRSAEALRLREENILHEHGKIEIPASKAKGGRRRRLSDIQPNLAAWLKLGGELRPTAEKTIRRVLFQSGVRWHKNATRHSWESYHVAKFENRAKTSKQSGHSEKISEENYDAVALPRVAEDFFNIVPEPAERTAPLKLWGGARQK